MDLEPAQLTGTEVQLRRARLAHIPAIVDLLASDQLGTSRDGLHGPEDLLAYQRAFAAIDVDPAHLLVVGTTARAVVATLQLTLLPGLARRGARRMQVEAVRVRADRRGTGLGTAMLRWAIDQARKEGCDLVQLTSDKSRLDAQRFYDRLGFVASHEGFKLDL